MLLVRTNGCYYLYQLLLTSLRFHSFYCKRSCSCFLCAKILVWLLLLLFLTPFTLLASLMLLIVSDVLGNRMSVSNTADVVSFHAAVACSWMPGKFAVDGVPFVSNTAAVACTWIPGMSAVDCVPSVYITPLLLLVREFLGCLLLLASILYLTPLMLLEREFLGCLLLLASLLYVTPLLLLVREFLVCLLLLASLCVNNTPAVASAAVPLVCLLLLASLCDNNTPAVASAAAGMIVRCSWYSCCCLRPFLLITPLLLLAPLLLLIVRCSCYACCYWCLFFC